jgi:hypothetical protein
MSTNNTQAFPKSQWEATGMTLRDYFAAKAMQGLINEQVEVIPTLAQIAYEIADAMLKERE